MGDYSDLWSGRTGGGGGAAALRAGLALVQGPEGAGSMRGWVWGVLMVATGVFLGGLAVKLFWWWIVLGEIP